MGGVVKRRLVASGAGKKSEETRARILEAALKTFRVRGFEQATMREIAAEAGMAVGAAYYYFDSKDAIVLAFYAEMQAAMKARVDAELDGARTLEARLRAIIEMKFATFAPNRKLLGALSAHSNPEHPLSPFGKETAAIREEDTALFERAVTESKVKLPPRIRPYLARLLWLYQMGLILFWVYDKSAGQRRTNLLFEKTLKMLLVTLKIAGFPLLRPVHTLAAELLEAIYGD